MAIQNSPEQEIQVNSSVKAINTTIMLLSQKIGYLIRNEKILSQNIIVLNDKIKKLDLKIDTNQGNNSGNSINVEELDSLKSQIKELYNKINSLKADIEELSSKIDKQKEIYITRKEFMEMKYLIDSINPLEYVTYKQVKELLKKE